MNRVARLLVAYGLLSSLFACQTVGRQEAPPLPETAQAAFAPCYPKDGAVSLQVFSSDAFRGAVEAEWAALPNGDWDILATAATGQTVLSGTRRGDHVNFAGPLAPKVPKIAILEDGFLALDGNLLGIKASEVPCFLAFALPKTWVALADAVTKAKGGANLAFSDDVRQMHVKIPTLAASRTNCAEVIWQHHLILSHSLTFCFVSERQGTLSGLGDYTLKWVKLDER